MLPARKIARSTGEIEFRGLNFSYDGKQVLHDVNLRVPGGQQPGDRRPDRLRQDNPGQPDSAHLRRRAGHGFDRRTPDSRILARVAAQEHRIRAAGDFSVQRPHPREHCARRGLGHRPARFTTRPKPPTSPPTSRASPKATTPWSENAASRSPAGRSSAPPLPAL